MTKIDVTEADLLCGTHPPLSRRVREALRQRDSKPDVLHHASAGRHLSMLTICRKLGYRMQRYPEREHPVQRYLWQVASNFLNHDAPGGDYAPGRCACPIPLLPLENWAIGASRLCCGEGGARLSASRVRDAMTRFPEMVTYPKHYMLRIHSATGGKILYKTGLCSTCIACHVPSGVGIAFKVRDGQEYLFLTSVLIPLLRRLDLLTSVEWEALQDLAEPEIITSTGSVVGKTEAVFESNHSAE